MSNPVAKLSSTNDIRWWCDGCVCFHIVPTTPGAPNGWVFNGDYNRPTLSPSVLVQSHKALINTDLPHDQLTDPSNIYETPVCHSFIRDGMIQYLGDCTHALAGLTVPMTPV